MFEKLDTNDINEVFIQFYSYILIQTLKTYYFFYFFFFGNQF